MSYGDPSLEDDAILRYGLRNPNIFTTTTGSASSAGGSSAVRRRLDAVQELDFGFGRGGGGRSAARTGVTPEGRALFTDPVSALDDDDFLYGNVRSFGGSTGGGASSRPSVGGATAYPPSQRSASSFTTSMSRFSTHTRLADEHDPSFGVRGHEALFGASPQMPDVDSPVPAAPPVARSFLAPQSTPPRATARVSSQSTPTPVRGVAEEIDLTGGDVSANHYRSAARSRPSSSRGRDDASAFKSSTSPQPTRTRGATESPQVKRFLSAMRTAVEPDSPLPRPPQQHQQHHQQPATSHPHILGRQFKLSVDPAALKASTYAAQFTAVPATAGADAAGAWPIICEVERVLSTVPASMDESPESNGTTDAADDFLAAPIFSHQSDISTLVNIGDAAHCRVIELRSAFSSERDAQLAMLAATSTLVSTIKEELIADISHLPFDDSEGGEGDAAGGARGNETPVEQTFDNDTDSIRRLRQEVADAMGREESQQPRRPMRTSLESSDDDEPRPQRNNPPAEQQNESSGDDAFDAGKKLIPLCDEPSRRDVNSVLAHCGNMTASGTHAIAQIFKSLASEASGKAIVPSPIEVDAERHWTAAQTLGVREAEAKATGNLAVCAQLRRELITTLHEALNQSLDAAESAEAPFTALSPARRLTQTLLARARKESAKHLSYIAEQHETALRRLVDVQQRQKRLTDLADLHHRDALNFMADNDRTISNILTQIDDLYDQLDVAVYARNNRLKTFLRHKGSTAYHMALVEREGEAQQGQIATLAERMVTAKGTVEALDECDVLVRNLRRYVEEKNAYTLDKMVATRDEAFSQCEEFFTELRTCAGGWMDVLMKNAAREMERETTLRAAIADATERYHQADRDQYQQQLNETEHRRKMAETEVAACEAILRKNTARMTTLSMRRTESSGGVSRPTSAGAAPGSATMANAHPAFGSRPATPLRTAAPRFAHQHAATAVESPVPMRQHQHAAAPSGVGRPPLSAATHIEGVPHHEAAQALVVHNSFTPGHTPVHQPDMNMSPPPHSTPGFVMMPSSLESMEYHPATLAAFHEAVNEMPIADIVAMLPKSRVTKEKWLVCLVDMDIEFGRELRGMRDTAGVWSGVLLQQPLLKSLIEQVLDTPEKFMELDDDSPKPTSNTAVMASP